MYWSVSYMVTWARMTFLSMSHLPIKSERDFWLVSIEMVSRYASDGFDMSIIKVQYFLVQLNCLCHVIQLLGIVKELKEYLRKGRLHDLRSESSINQTIIQVLFFLW